MSTIRPLELGDAAAVFAAVDCSRDALRRWMEWYHDAYSLSDAEAWIQQALAARSEGTAFHFAVVEDDGRFVGAIGLEDVSGGRAMIGYWIATPATGRGVATRSVEEALRWAQSGTEIRTVWAVAAEANAPSGCVLTANGFRRVGARGIDSRGDVPLLYEVDLRTAELPSEH